jgi:2-oxoglutarate/2-oxoacid ferredoxin oxidoreductase subunit alpha
MSENLKNNIFTIGVGGAAGEGVKTVGMQIGNALKEMGLQIFQSVDYPSLIRGGHNFVRMSFQYEVTNGLTDGNEYKSKLWSDYSKLDILVCLNGETKEIHKNELNEGVWVLEGLKNEEILAKVKEFLNTKNLVASVGNEVENPEGKNEKEKTDKKRELIDGNTAFARGLQSVGLDFYISYPMTPATTILHYLASKQKKDGLKVIQPENEIAAINMALGAAYAGKKAAVGTATGGFALMQEAFSFAGMAELPIVVLVSQRQAPATGVPTRSSQSDLRFAIHAGHGEFPRIVIAPGDTEECFEAGANALNLAWKYRVPVIVLIDKILSEHMMTVEIERLKDGTIEKLEEKNKEKNPGMEGKVVKITSYEHDQDGFTAEKPEEVKVAMDRRFVNGEKIKEEMQNYEGVKVFGPSAQTGDQNSDNVIVFFGSTKGPVLEASKYLNKSAKLVQIICVEPFPTEKVLEELKNKKIICVEGNHDGQLASLIREKTGIEIVDKILKYDSMPFDPEELAREINKIL